MSHCAKQIRDWFVATIDAVGGVPTPKVGVPRQVKENTDYVYIKHGDEPITTENSDAPRLQFRNLSVDVVVVAGTYDEVDAYSVLIEEALEAAVNFPGKILDLTTRLYEEDKTTDRDYVALTLSYVAVYFVNATDVETFA